MAKHTLQEEWRPIPGYEGLYEVSSHGRVKSYKRYSTGRVIHGDLHAKYAQVALTKDGSTKVCLVHRLVMEAFVGHSDRWVNHIDGDKRNNRLDNLEYVTPSENAEHAVLMGFNGPAKYRRRVPQTDPRQHRRSVAEDNPEIVKLAESIRNEYASGFVTRSTLAEKHNVSEPTISRILRGEWWA